MIITRHRLPSLLPNFDLKIAAERLTTLTCECSVHDHRSSLLHARLVVQLDLVMLSITPAYVFGSDMKMYYKNLGPLRQCISVFRRFSVILARSLSCGHCDPCIGFPRCLYLLPSL